MHFPLFLLLPPAHSSHPSNFPIILITYKLVNSHSDKMKSWMEGKMDYNPTTAMFLEWCNWILEKTVSGLLKNLKYFRFFAWRYVSHGKPITCMNNAGPVSLQELLASSRQWFSEVWALDQEAVAPGNLLEKQIFRPRPRSTDSEILKARPSNMAGRYPSDCAI